LTRRDRPGCCHDALGGDETRRMFRNKTPVCSFDSRWVARDTAGTELMSCNSDWRLSMSLRAPWRAGDRPSSMLVRAALVCLVMLCLGGIARLSPAPVAGSPASDAFAQASGTPEASVNLTVQVEGTGVVTVSPGPESSSGTPDFTIYTYPVGTVVTLTTIPQGMTIFAQWRIDGASDPPYGDGWASPLTITLDEAHSVVASFPTIPNFSDVPQDHPAYEAISNLGSRAISWGYGPAGCMALGRATPCYAPEQYTVRAESAVFLTRILGLQGENRGDGGFTDVGEQAPAVRQAIGAMEYHGIFRGYGDGRFGPNDRITHLEMALVISRAMVFEGYWTRATVDDPSIYPNLDLGTEARLDLVTFVQNAGTLPGFSNVAQRAPMDLPAPRDWTAQALWQALDTYFGVDAEGKGGYVP
jgi:hypothetical protein